MPKKSYLNVYFNAEKNYCNYPKKVELIQANFHFIGSQTISMYDSYFASKLHEYNVYTKWEAS